MFSTSGAATFQSISCFKTHVRARAVVSETSTPPYLLGRWAGSLGRLLLKVTLLLAGPRLGEAAPAAGSGSPAWAAEPLGCCGRMGMGDEGRVLDLLTAWLAGADFVITFNSWPGASAGSSSFLFPYSMTTHTKQGRRCQAGLRLQTHSRSSSREHLTTPGTAGCTGKYACHESHTKPGDVLSTINVALCMACL